MQVGHIGLARLKTLRRAIAGGRRRASTGELVTPAVGQGEGLVALAQVLEARLETFLRRGRTGLFGPRFKRRFDPPKRVEWKMICERLAPSAFNAPSMLLSGVVDYNIHSEFRRMLVSVPAEGLVTMELSTLGGDPEVARMMGEDIRFLSDADPNRRFVFLGKAAIYSAGTTFMSFFARTTAT